MYKQVDEKFSIRVEIRDNYNQFINLNPIYLNFSLSLLPDILEFIKELDFTQKKRKSSKISNTI
jgi:hypothetical protein